MKWSFRDAWLRASIFWADGGGQYAKAMSRLEKLEHRRPLGAHWQAFKAYLLLRTMQPDEARKLLISVRDQIRNRTDPESQYLTHYTQYWLAIIQSDPFNAREQSRKARQVECRPLLKRQLWVGNVDREDPLDAEFDAWIAANPPDEEALRKRNP